MYAAEKYGRGLFLYCSIQNSQALLPFSRVQFFERHHEPLDRGDVAEKSVYNKHPAKKRQTKQDRGR